MITIESFKDDLELRKTSEELNFDDISSITESELNKYLSKNGELIKIGNVEIIIISQEHTNDEINPALESLCKAKNTKVIFVEYFEPELQSNARNFPVIGSLVENLYFKNKDYREKKAVDKKVGVSSQLVEIAKENKKTIATADIANKAEYYIGYSLFPTIEGIISLYLPILQPAVILHYVMYFISRYQEYFSKSGFFDKEKVHSYENVLLDIEDARRLFVAKGLLNLAVEYNSKNESPNRIIAVYPKAHAMRIAKYLSQSSQLEQISSKFKNMFYRLYPGIKISVRQYVWKMTLSKLFKEQSLSAWQKISDRKI